MKHRFSVVLILVALMTETQAQEPKTDNEILAGADTRICQIRMGNLTVAVRDAKGKPIPGARVRIEQTRHEFLFGCNIFMLDRFPTKEENEQYKSRFAALLNFATLPLYWAGFEPERDRPQYPRIEAMARWCREAGIITKGHPLVWNHSAGAPRWLPSDPAEVQKRSNERVKACVERFKGLVDIFDVVNEAADPLRPGFENPVSDLIRKIGVEEFTRRPFCIAREANPTALLLINDYRTDAKYEKVVQFLSVNGKRLYDVIGIQSHMHGGVWPMHRTWEVCERYSRYGVPIHFTETTVLSGPNLGSGKYGETTPELEEKQAREVVAFYTAIFSHPAVEAITWWDFCDRGAWQKAPAGLLRKDLSPKPAYTALLKKIKEDWWTRAEGRTNEQGDLQVRVFFGTHRVAVAAPDGRTLESEATVNRKQGQAACAVVMR
ncbi:MAG: endo-1,4-beta-xylanase [Planctomycetota bacterium]